MDDVHNNHRLAYERTSAYKLYSEQKSDFKKTSQSEIKSKHTLKTEALYPFNLDVQQIKRRKDSKNKRFSSYQSDYLERIFQMRHYLSGTEKKIIACSLGMTEKQVKTWFQNKRAKAKKKYFANR